MRNKHNQTKLKEITAWLLKKKKKSRFSGCCQF